MKIVHIFPVVKFGGAPLVVLNLIKNDKENSHIVISKKDDEILTSEFEKYACKFYNINTLKISILSTFSVIKVLLIERPQIVHAHGKGGAFYAFFSSIFLFKPAKIVYTMHGYNNKFDGLKFYMYTFFEKIFSTLVDRHIAVSASERRKFLTELAFAEEQVIVIENGISVEEKKLNKRQMLILGRSSYNIVTFSRISPQKDLETMLHSFSELLKKPNKKSIALHIIGGHIDGDKAYLKKILALHKSLKLENNVIFWDDLPFASSFLQYFDLYWSTALWEGLPTAIIESMLKKILVVSTDVVGNIDLVNVNTGILTPVKDHHKIAEKLHSAIGANNDTLVENAFVFATNNFSSEQYKLKICSLYREVAL
jgi:glycosyltransferase involved in cell wall biosynthesis